MIDWIRVECFIAVQTIDVAQRIVLHPPTDADAVIAIPEDVGQADRIVATALVQV